MEKKTIEERFWEKVDIRGEDECWNWAASGRGVGYGCIKYNGKVIDSHRMAYILAVGEIRDGLLVCHKCDNRMCCNPSHLFLGTYTDNNRDMLVKGRFATGNKSGRVQHPERWDEAIRKMSKYLDAPDGTKWCHRCKRYIPKQDIVKDRSSVDGLDNECKECKRSRSHGGIAQSG